MRSHMFIASNFNNLEKQRILKGLNVNNKGEHMMESKSENNLLFLYKVSS